MFSSPRAKYAERLTTKVSTTKQKVTDVSTEELRPTNNNNNKKNILKDQVTSGRALVSTAKELISSGIRPSDLNKVQCGHVLLIKGNTAQMQVL